MRKTLLAVLFILCAAASALAIGTRLSGIACTGSCTTAIHEYQPAGTPTLVVPGLDYNGSYNSSYTKPSDCSGNASTCSLSTKTLVLIVIGQSVSANYTNFHYATLSDNVQFLDPYNQTVYKLDSATLTGNTTYAPALGGAGFSSQGILNCASSTLYCQGTYLGALGDCLVAVASNPCSAGSALYSRVIFISLGIGSSSVNDWSPLGNFNHRLLTQWLQLVGLGWNTNSNVHIGVLYSQGEQDAVTNYNGGGAAGPPSTGQWESSFESIVASYAGIGGTAPWFVIEETLSALVPANSAVQAAQTGVVALGTINGLSIYSGALGASRTGGVSCTNGFDSISATYRWDGTHMGLNGSNNGIPMAANCVYNAIAAHPP